MQNASFRRIKKLVLTGFLAASMTGGKLALMSIPNVEIVTLIILASTAAFGLGISLPAVFVFVTTETILFGGSTWVVSYYIYWGLLAAAAALSGRLFKKKNAAYIVTGILMTALFGVLTSFVDTIFAAGVSSRGFFEIFAIIYVRGIYFYVLHAGSNAVILLFLLPPFRTALEKLSARYLGDSAKSIEQSEEI